MRVHQIRGGSLEELESKKYNIGVGVSLGNKWFTPEHIVEQTKWALEFAREHVVVYVADTIHAINIQVRKRVSHKKALGLAVKEGQALLSEVKKKIGSSFESLAQSKIQYATWADVVDKDYNEKLAWLHAFYEEDLNFRDGMHTIVKEHISKERKIFSDSDIHKLGAYLIEELPEILCRVPIKGTVYEAYTYPFDSIFLGLVEDIQQGTTFTKVRDAIMDTNPKVFLEVR